MSKSPELPPRVYPKGRWYYLVTAEGTKRVWTKLTLIGDGIPALYRKLADLKARDIAPDRIPMLVVDWLDEVGATHGKKQRENDTWVMNTISTAMAEFRAREVTTPTCLAFLKPYRAKPRTHNLMRTGLLELMRYAEGKESDGVPFREPNSNPVSSIKRLATPARDRYPTDSEVRRIKFHAMVARVNSGTKDPAKMRKYTESGPMICGLIDLAYLTGQRIGDLLNLRWDKRAATDGAGAIVAPYIAADGIHFKPSKTAKSTGAKIIVTWTPKLRAAVARIEKRRGRSLQGHVATNQEGRPLIYSTFATAWWRACDRAGIKGLHFHDLKAKALTDTDETQGRKAAQTKGGHSTERQTDDYLRGMKAQKTEATK